MDPGTAESAQKETGPALTALPRSLRASRRSDSVSQPPSRGAGALRARRRRGLGCQSRYGRHRPGSSAGLGSDVPTARTLRPPRRAKTSRTRAPPAARRRADTQHGMSRDPASKTRTFSDVSQAISSTTLTVLYLLFVSSVARPVTNFVYRFLTLKKRVFQIHMHGQTVPGSMLLVFDPKGITS